MQTSLVFLQIPSLLEERPYKFIPLTVSKNIDGVHRLDSLGFIKSSVFLSDNLKKLLYILIKLFLCISCSGNVVKIREDPL